LINRDRGQNVATKPLPKTSASSKRTTATTSKIARLKYLTAVQGFLESERDGADKPETAQAVVIPFGLEASVSYGHGTAKGPAAILEASKALELFDEELWAEPYRAWGVATLAPPRIKSPNAAALDQLAELVEGVVAQDKFPLVLGGEHALTPGAIRPLVQRHPDLVVLQLDAHADLRDGYLGEHFSHAAAMRRVLDNPGVSLVQVGIRAISAGEVPFLEANRHRISVHWGKDIRNWQLEEIVAPLNGRPVYITFDIDALDPSLMPATGTPEPGGIPYEEALAILKRASQVARIVGADIVELAPIKGLHAPDFVAARLASSIRAMTNNNNS
jgi:agmatinase